MYVPTAFEIESLAELHDMIRACALAWLVTRSEEGLQANPVPLFLDSSEGKFGTLYGHLARGNHQWRSSTGGTAMALFMGPNAYVTPSWYPTKAATGKVVPTWNYLAVEAHGSIEFFNDPERLREVVTRLTRLHEQQRPSPWALTDAPADFITSQLHNIVGIRMAITGMDGKRKMSQNRNAEDRAGVIEGLSHSDKPDQAFIAKLIPR
jgi:transcriptional regulator